LALALVLAWLLFVPAADWLAHHDVGSVTGSLHETALDNARGRLLTLGAGLFAAGALAFTARTFYLSREGQVTDRYTKAIKQLGSDQLAVRIGGIYALERVARDSARDQPTVMEALPAFIREPPYSRQEHGTDAGRDRLWPDVQAAVTVIGRRISRNDRGRIDLSGAGLGGAGISGANLCGANLSGANLVYADLTRANLDGANLSGALWSPRDPAPAGWTLDGDRLRWLDARG
jgi:Pentapeptide repeats (8 copies)